MPKVKQPQEKSTTNRILKWCGYVLIGMSIKIIELLTLSALSLPRTSWFGLIVAVAVVAPLGLLIERVRKTSD